MRKSLIILGVLAGAMLCATHAKAGTIDVTGIAVPNYDQITVHDGSINELTNAGPQILTTSAGTLDAWCIDLFDTNNIGAGQNLEYSVGTTYTNGAGGSLTSGQISDITHLVAFGDAAISNSNVVPIGISINDFMAAVQVAIWQDEYGAGFSYSGANLSHDINVVNADAVGYTTTLQSLIALDGTQNLVVDAIVPVTNTPEPSGVAAIALGLIVLGVLAMRRRSGRLMCMAV